ncbi:MAG: hypothetical protein HZA52_03165 [Planctomycetes bacterium]|nr:hypothetical protein [Planctomycetota bacterium]
MGKLWIGGSVLALGLVGVQATPLERTAVFKEERVSLEYNATLGEIALCVEAESEASVIGLEVRDPRGVPMLRMKGGQGAALALSGFVVESREMTPDELRHEHPEGLYTLRGTSADGEALLGSATLSYALPSAATIEYPPDGAVGVSADGFELRWSSDASAVAYEISLEQEESDTMKVTLPAGAQSFDVPKGFLKSGMNTHVEVVTVGAEGNRTIVEHYFTTR